MRQGQFNNKRMRGRNRKGPNPLTRSYESNGGDVKIRGTALHIAEKYVQLARDAQSSGDRVAAENYLQHAEHYYRIVAAAQAQMPQPQPVYRSDEERDEEEAAEGFQGANNPYPQPGQGQPAFSGEQQPYANANGTSAEQEDDDVDMGDNRFEPRDIPMLTREIAPRSDNREQNFNGGGFNGNNGGNRPNDQGGGHRGRRRRPFRERHGGEREGQPQGGETPRAPTETPRGDE
ncbi:MAG TPA: DUF4167 domain-containing protein [Bauldia sp.]|nr:DUF4167 domain-containing protein [Bauldia sp.]